MAEISTILKDLRNEKGISQDRLAEELGTTRSAIGNYETGRRLPSYEMAEKIADFYNVDMMYLLGKQDKKRMVAISNPIINDRTVAYWERLQQLAAEKQEIVFDLIDKMENL